MKAGHRLNRITVRILGVAALLVCSGIACCAGGQVPAPVLVTFDDLTPGQPVPYLYKGIYWPVGTDGIGGLEGRPYVVDKLANGSPPRSKPNVMINQWGVRRINIRFESGLARFYGGWFMSPDMPQSQGAMLVAFLGFRNGKVVGASPTLAPSSKPAFLAYSSPTLVDEIQITSATTWPDSKRWYNLDNLLYTPVPEPGSGVALAMFGAGYAAAVVRRRKSRGRSQSTN